MKYTNKQIYEALNIIKETCNEADDDKCIECPLSNSSGVCNIVHSDVVPGSWKLNNADKKWMAFRSSNSVE